MNYRRFIFTGAALASLAWAGIGCNQNRAPEATDRTATTMPPAGTYSSEGVTPSTGTMTAPLTTESGAAR